MHEVRRSEDLMGVSIQTIDFWDVMPYTVLWYTGTNCLDEHAATFLSEERSSRFLQNICT
jgi:hypothetical protein